MEVSCLPSSLSAEAARAPGLSPGLSQPGTFPHRLSLRAAGAVGGRCQALTYATPLHARPTPKGLQERGMESPKWESRRRREISIGRQVGTEQRMKRWSWQRRETNEITVQELGLLPSQKALGVRGEDGTEAPWCRRSPCSFSAPVLPPPGPSLSTGDGVSATGLQATDTITQLLAATPSHPQ